MTWASAFAGVAGLAIACLLLTGCGKNAGDDLQTLHVGSQRGGTKAVMIASGALEGAPYKVEWSEFPAAQHLLEAIGGGAVDVGLVGDAPFMFAYQNGSNIRAVGAQFVPTRPKAALSLIVPASSSAHSLADLHGKRVATTRGSVGHYLVLRALLQAKLPPDWVTLVFLPPGDAKAAFDSGSIDGWATWAPYLSAAIKGGARIIADGNNLAAGYGFEVANANAIEKKRAILADFLKREAKGLNWAHANTAAFAKVLSQETGMPLDVARDYAEKNKRERVPIDDTVIADQQTVLDTFKSAGAIEGKRKLADGFDRTLNPVRTAAR